MRGEYSSRHAIRSKTSGSPPHARGIPPVIFDLVTVYGITPACAGNTQSVRKCRQGGQDHPRMRGEYKKVTPGDITVEGPPPHARGIRWTYPRKHTEQKDHPHMRGEYKDPSFFFISKNGPPSHARGIRIRHAPGNAADGFTPACAGNTNHQVLRTVRTWVHPRMRGEYVRINAAFSPQSGSPPHARGIPC